MSSITYSPYHNSCHSNPNTDDSNPPSLTFLIGTTLVPKTAIVAIEIGAGR